MRFAFHRFWAVVLKEFIQMKRDRMTFGMMAGIPLLQLTLFGFAINADPKRLPTAVVAGDQGPFTRSFIAAMRHTEYFAFTREFPTQAEAARALELGDAQFVVNIPEDFSRRLLRGEQPSILVEADATDPSATGPAIAALQNIAQNALDRDLTGPLEKLRAGRAPIRLQVHARYNPENITQYNVVPGLMGVVLTMTMIIITALAITRERERGTMENLLATPARPLEVMTGKILPYILVGYVQLTLILLAARFIFDVPMVGSLALVYAVALLFIASNLAVGITFSTLARNQLQAVQMAFFFFLPSILLSGFMFPFRGMPEWAQWVGSCLPLTHFLRIVRGILLKGNGLTEIAPKLWPILLFMTLAMTLALKRYRQTLD
ncbi:MAG: ABC transporter permease [Verrucomicrobia bacterium]|nr:ABC transporter permease [Verrucomicrobiota bacterium]MBI3868835.1 ABC transporter permease [Verrucomicrobiota bacterium]